MIQEQIEIINHLNFAELAELSDTLQLLTDKDAQKNFSDFRSDLSGMYHKSRVEIIDKVGISQQTLDKGEHILLYSYTNLKRVENFLDTKLWMGGQFPEHMLDYTYMVMNPTGGGLPTVAKNYPTLYDAYGASRKRYDGTIDTIGIMGNIVVHPVLFETNLKHFCSEKNKDLYSNKYLQADFGFYLAIPAVLSNVSLVSSRYIGPDNHLSRHSDAYDTFKEKVDYKTFTDKILSAQGHKLREEAYPCDWEGYREDVENGKRKERLERNSFSLVIYYSALYALNNAKNNKDTLSPYLHRYENLIDLLIYEIIIRIENRLFGYFSGGRLRGEELGNVSPYTSHKQNPRIPQDKKAYDIYMNGQPESDKPFLPNEFNLINKSIFDEVNESLLPIGQDYIGYLYELISAMEK